MTQLPGWFVVVMGLGTVFVGLICIILLCTLLGGICRMMDKNAKSSPDSLNAAPAPQSAFPPEKRGEIIAAISAVIAEENGTDLNGIRIHAIRKI